MSSLTYIELLGGNRHFRNLWLGQVVAELGSWFNFIAVLGLVRVISGAAPEAAAILVVARTAPFAVFAPLAGALVDRLSRKTVMLVADLARSIIVLGYLFVDSSDDLWIVYVSATAIAILSAFFEAAKNAALPNVTGERGLLPGNALMFSSRFLLMSIGAALGGAASAYFGYEAAFFINAVSFAVSAFSIWLIPGEELHGVEILTGENKISTAPRTSFLNDLKEGWRFIGSNSLVLTIIGVNIIWGIGGGAINLIADRLGGVVFAGQNGLSADAAVAVLYTGAGAGLFVGMILARQVGDWVISRNLVVPFIGWTIIVHGILYALSGQMPSLWLVVILQFFSRVLLGVEYAVQETILMRSIPDRLRGRVMTTDRAAEIFIMSVSSLAAGYSLYAISPGTLTLIAGVVSGLSGVFWLVRVWAGKPKASTFAGDNVDDEKLTPDFA